MLFLSKFRLRHNILKVLQAKSEGAPNRVQVADISLTEEEISQKLGITRERVLEELEILVSKGHIHWEPKVGIKTELCITAKGAAALYDKAYISEGYKESLDKFLKISQIATLWIGATIALITIVKNLNRVENLESRVDVQEQRLMELEKKEKQSLPPLLLSDSTNDKKPALMNPQSETIK